MSDENVVDRLSVCDDQRIFCVFEALKRGVSVDKIHEITLIDEWFLNKLLILVDMENKLKEGNIDEATYFKAKKLGFLDRTIEAYTCLQNG